MGDYISQSDLVEAMSYQRIRMLTDDPDSKSVVAATVTKAIESAEGEVNSFVAKQYDVPVVGTIPDPLKRWSVTLATLILHQRRPPVPDDVWRAADACRVQLDKMAAGGISLDIGSSDATEADGFEPEFEYEPRQFTHTKFSGW